MNILFKNKADAAGPSRVRDIRYSEDTKELPPTPVTRTAKAIQQLLLTDEAPSPVQ